MYFVKHVHVEYVYLLGYMYVCIALALGRHMLSMWCLNNFINSTVMVTNWCPLSRRRSMSWKWVSSTSSRTSTSQRSPSPSTQPSRVSSKRPVTAAVSPQWRTSVGPWVTQPFSMPSRRTSVDGLGRYKR